MGLGLQHGDLPKAGQSASLPEPPSAAPEYQFAPGWSASDKVNLRRAQTRLSMMLVAVDQIMRSHNLTYWVCSGTLMGAVRYGGWIPHDGGTLHQ